MNRSHRGVLLAMTLSLTIAACKTTGPAAPAPGSSAPGTGAPTAPNPAPAPPGPAVTPVPTAVPAQPASAAMAPAQAAPPETAIPPQPAAAPAAPARPHQDILKLKQAGFTDEFLLNKIHTDNVAYQLTTSEMVELRGAGFSETVLDAMLRSGQTAAATAGAPVQRKAEFYGLARVGKGFLVFGTSAKKTGRLVVDGETISWYDADDPKRNFSAYTRNIKEIFNTCVLRPGQNLCLEFGFVTYTGDEYRFRDPGWKNGENKLVTQATDYFRLAFPNLFFSQRAVNEL